jgi:thiol-disulfide isomerase/thioredoxin
MTKLLRFTIPIILLAAICYCGQVSAQIPTRKGPAPAQEIEKALAVVTQHMDSIRAHKAYIYKMGLNNPLLIPQYKAWMKKYPQNITIPLSIGTVYYNAEMSQAREFLLQAAEIEPQNAKIWYMLSADAFNRGETALQTGYIEKATLYDPSDARYAFGYLASFKDGNPEIYKQKAIEFVTRFPKNERGAQVLYWLGEGAVNVDEKIQYLEQLRKTYPPKQFTWSSAGMTGLADAYLQTDPKKALVLIDEMGGEKDWQMRKGLANLLIQVSELEQKKNYNEAAIELNKVKLPHLNYIDEFITLKKASLQAKTGDIKLAYDSLANKFAKLPTERLDSALKLYGKEIGKDATQIKDDINAIRASNAPAAYPFNLGLYGSKDSLSLNNLKGKVVLLTFWFPGCVPCRDEFPHFESVINKFKGKDIVYIGINVSPEQDPYVAPFMKNTGYSFIPLRGNQEFADKRFGVQGEPENFLIDKGGKILFKGFRIDQKNQRTLEMMIASLLNN